MPHEIRTLDDKRDEVRPGILMTVVQYAQLSPAEVQDETRLDSDFGLYAPLLAPMLDEIEGTMDVAFSREEVIALAMNPTFGALVDLVADQIDE